MLKLLVIFSFKDLVLVIYLFSLGVVEAVKKEAELQKKKFIIPPETTQIGLEDAIVGAEPRSGRDLEEAEDRKGRDLGDKKKNIAKKKAQNTLILPK